MDYSFEDPRTGEVVEDHPVLAGISFEIDRIADALDEREPTRTEAARLAALQDAARIVRGERPSRRPELEPGFGAVVDDYMTQWRAKKSAKETNTEQQKLATFALFRSFWRDRPLRDVREPDAARFHDALRLLSPHWARSPEARGLSFDELVERFGNNSKGLSQGTMNRHMAALASLWKWARKRGHCEGDNPFEGFHVPLRAGVNFAPYLAWEVDELKQLLHPRPHREDLLEVILVGLFSAMRLNEIADLKWKQLRHEEAIWFFDVRGAKTSAGDRQVPLHPRLHWLLGRPRGKPNEAIWPTFNPEGPGKKRGADASREFSRFKASRGFTDEAKVFHSFRKNVTRIMERAGVPMTEWAQVFGHERGFTFRVYNQDGISLQRKADIIGLINYPGLELPAISSETLSVAA